MGGYQLSYEAFQTFISNQALMAKAEREKYEETKDRSYLGSARGREEAVFELALYLNAPDVEVKKFWEDDTA